MRTFVALCLATSLACAGGGAHLSGSGQAGAGVPVDPPAVAPVDPPAAEEGTVKTRPGEEAARRWGAQKLGVAEGDVAVLPLSDLAGDPIYGVKRKTDGKEVAATAVLVHGEEVVAGRSGFEAWVKAHDHGDPVPLAVACSFLALGSRGEPVGADPDDDEGPRPTFDAQGRLLFSYRGGQRSQLKKAVVTFAADGSVAAIDAG